MKFFVTSILGIVLAQFPGAAQAAPAFAGVTCVATANAPATVSLWLRFAEDGSDHVIVDDNIWTGPRCQGGATSPCVRTDKNYRVEGETLSVFDDMASERFVISSESVTGRPILTSLDDHLTYYCQNLRPL